VEFTIFHIIFSILILNMEIFCITLPVLHNIIMDLNNVMPNLSLWIDFYSGKVRHGTFFQGCPLNIMRLLMNYIFDFLRNHFHVTIYVVFNLDEVPMLNTNFKTFNLKCRIFITQWHNIIHIHNNVQWD
jgi:hypothetical protein